jgi:predicted MPP superfamily phosphohydrolase
MALLDAELRAPLGVYAVPGNHDNDAGPSAWHRALAGTSITDLTDRFVTRDVGGARLRIAGLDDVNTGRPRPEQALPDDAADCTVLLAHNPDQVEEARERIGKADLVLSGHTHGGQIRLPFVGATVNSARHAELYEWGLVRRPWTQVYVSRGVGTVHQRLRFLCRPEVAILELAPG